MNIRHTILGAGLLFSLAAAPAFAQQGEQELLDFMYQYMPLPDSTDYSRDFYLQNIRTSLKAKAEMPWGRIVPDREFRHFVLPVRVNNENLDNARMVIYEMLKPRIQHLSMYDAVLEVNHWCHEYVTYQPSDARTSAPLATMRNGLGRCGEESTFTVAALRAMGIPARQVYTPRWAHTDDNHAWVEAWVDGRWYFLGACEPEPVLNLGWFNAPASRAMLMHTKVFGHYDGPETVMQENRCYTEIDVTSNYAPVSEVRVHAVDRKGRPTQANVEFKLYNYAEFYTLSRKATDPQGIASFHAGNGDLLIWASTPDGKHFGFSQCSMGQDHDITIVMDKDARTQGVWEMTLTPPRERNTIPALTDQQVSHNKSRLATEDSIRTARQAGFYTMEQARNEADAMGLNADVIAPILVEARANACTLRTFLQQHAQDATATQLVASLATKDWHDVSPDILTDHLQHTPTTLSSSPLWAPYVLSPRISNEMLTAYKGYFQQHLPTGIDISKWAEWVTQNIQVDEARNPQALCMQPISVWEHRHTDSHSRDIFFVAGARSMGIPARIDEVTGKVQWAGSNGEWHDVQFEQTKARQTAQGTLCLTYDATPTMDNPKYYSHFSISKIVDGAPQLLSYPEDGINWQNTFSQGEKLDAGTYLMVSGTRLASGGVMAHLTLMPVQKGKSTTRPLVMRQSQEDLTVIGNFNSENLYRTEDGKQKSLLSTTGRGYYVIGMIAPGQEPTNHALKDIARCQQELQQWGRSLILLFANEEDRQRFTNRSEFTHLPQNVVFGTDIDGKIHNEIWSGMKLTSPQYPVFLMADTFNRVVWMQQGYTIGLGEQLLKVIGKIQ